MTENQHGGGAGTLSMPTRRRKTKSRSVYVILLTISAGLVLGMWGIARFAVCWGDEGGIGTLLICNSHLASLAMLLAAFAVLVTLHLELSEMHMEEFQGRRMGRLWAIIYGNRDLMGFEFALVMAATLIGAGTLLLFLWFWIFSSVLF